MLNFNVLGYWRARYLVATSIAMVWLLGGGLSPLWAGSKIETLDTAQAQVLMAEAERFEQENQLRDAYYKYKRVESTYRVNDGISKSAWDNAQRLRLLFETGCKEIERVLERYRQEHGRYPDSLADVSDALSEQTLAMLDQFDYRRESDTSMSVHDGVTR